MTALKELMTEVGHLVDRVGDHEYVTVVVGDRPITIKLPRHLAKLPADTRKWYIGKIVEKLHNKAVREFNK